MLRKNSLLKMICVRVTKHHGQKLNLIHRCNSSKIAQNSRKQKKKNGTKQQKIAQNLSEQIIKINQKSSKLQKNSSIQPELVTITIVIHRYRCLAILWTISRDFVLFSCYCVLFYVILCCFGFFLLFFPFTTIYRTQEPNSFLN